MDKKYTPELVTEQNANVIFVFGSNLAGAHAGGAARIAMEKFGAVWGQGVGLQGQSYSIPIIQVADLLKKVTHWLALNLLMTTSSVAG